MYCGSQTVCTIDGLHFNSVYRARIRSYNATGPGPHSQPVRLQTAEGEVPTLCLPVRLTLRSLLGVEMVGLLVKIGNTVCPTILCCRNWFLHIHVTAVA